MQWNIALILEAVLLSILWRKKSPRWFSILIGVDLAASFLQLIPYRAGLRGIPVLIWEAGIVLAAPLGSMALIEAGEYGNGKVWETQHLRNPTKMLWHLRILAMWLCARLCIISLQTQPTLTTPLNKVLLTVDALAYVAWCVLFLL